MIIGSLHIFILGLGISAQVGFDDWRRLGVKGLRPKVVEFLNEVQRMAEIRLDILELENPGGNIIDYKLNIEANRSRWKIYYNNSDLVHRVMHM